MILGTIEENVFKVTKRGTYVLAGQVNSVTESLLEPTAVAHANAARKIVGKYKTWDDPVDPDLAAGVSSVGSKRVL